MRALKDAVKDLEEMLKMKEESSKLLMASLDSAKHIDDPTRALIKSLTDQIVWLKKRYSRLLGRFMKLDLSQNFIKAANSDLSSMLSEIREQFNNKMDFQLEENTKLKSMLQILEEKKKLTITEGKRRVLVTDTEEAFVILTSTNDGLKKEVNDKKADISVLKKENTDLMDENLQIKAELFKLAAMVKIQFFGRVCKTKLKTKEIREVESQPDASFDADESINWGPIELNGDKDNELRLPNFKINLEGFPGVESRTQEEMLKNARSDPNFQGVVMTTIGDHQQIHQPEVNRLVRNYRKALYHNQLLISALTKCHEQLKDIKAAAGGVRIQKPKRVAKQVPKRSGVSSKRLVQSRSLSKQNTMKLTTDNWEPNLYRNSRKPQDLNQSHGTGSTKVSLEDSKKLMRLVSQQLKSYFEKIVQRIISPCSFIRIDEKDVPNLKIKLTRAATW